MRLYLVLGVTMFALSACGSQADTTSPLIGEDAGVPDAACMPGSTAEDCARCPTPAPGCVRACPQVDCNVWPLPPECEGVCSDHECCECFAGTWVTSNPPVCGTECTGMEQDWEAIVAATSTCSDDRDCIAVGAPQTCNGDPTIGGDGAAVNKDLYQASNGPALEETYQATCTGGAVESRMPDVGCIHGTCGITALHTCDGPGNSGN